MRRAGPAGLTALLLLATPLLAAEYLGSHTWRPGWHGAGGYSALALDADGAGFAALSDRGRWVTGRLARDAAGVVDGVAVADRGMLFPGRPGLPDTNPLDPEGIARTPEGLFVSLESDHRVVRYGDLSLRPERLPAHPDFADFPVNRGLEALAADAEGRLYALPEGPRGGAFPVYRLDGGAWTIPFSVPAEGDFAVVGADVGPDARLYVLERDFAVLGFRSRIRSWRLDGTDGRTHLETPLLAHDNLEGLAVWRDAAGRLRATMVSDDNFRAVQRTEFVDYVLD